MLVTHSSKTVVSPSSIALMTICSTNVVLLPNPKHLLPILNELQYADDTALVSHTADGLQQLLDGMVNAYSRAGLVVIIKKTEILQQCPSPNLAPLVFNIKNCPIANVDQSVYLGTVLNNKLDPSPDIQRRVRLASTAFRRLSQRVFLTEAWTSRPRWPSARLSVSQRYFVVARHGSYIAVTSRRLNNSTFLAFIECLDYTGGTKSPT